MSPIGFLPIRVEMSKYVSHGRVICFLERSSAVRGDTYGEVTNSYVLHPVSKNAHMNCKEKSPQS